MEYLIQTLELIVNAKIASCQVGTSRRPDETEKSHRTIMIAARRNVWSELDFYSLLIRSDHTFCDREAEEFTDKIDELKELILLSFPLE